MQDSMHRPERFNTLATIGVEGSTLWVARFKMNPFTSIGFHTADIDVERQQMLDNVGKLLSGLTQWRVKDRSMHILMHSSLVGYDWSAYFCMHVGHIGGHRIISACGPFGTDGGDNDFRLEPADPMIRLYEIGPTIIERLKRQESIEKEVEESIPAGQTWDWYEAISVLHLYNEQDYIIKKENNGRPIVSF